MTLEYFLLNGYGQFVWPAFIFTFFSCFVLYLKSYKELKKYQKIYLKELAYQEPIKVEDFQPKEALSRSPIY